MRRSRAERGALNGRLGGGEADLITRLSEAARAKRRAPRWTGWRWRSRHRSRYPSGNGLPFVSGANGNTANPNKNTADIATPAWRMPS